MEENAKKVALKAAAALKESSENQNRFEPTWTGSKETNQAGGDAVASAVGGGGNGMASSRSLLANLQNKRMQIAASRAKPDANVQDEETKKHVALLLRIKKYMLQDLQWRGSNNKKDTE